LSYAKFADLGRQRQLRDDAGARTTNEGVLTPFTPPVEKYGPGHLGVDLAAAAGVSVQAAGAGVVRFAGPVAGHGVVVLVHPDGISTEYEPVAAVVVAGQRVAAGQRIGTVRGAHRSCIPASCLHWGARRGSAYLDPMSLLRPLGVVRLLPWT
jgi:murein DD-endopeptidase MepM/ murein hydrolase activator NlpD